jgi:hypothetical protein
MAKNSSFEELANCPSFARAVSNPRTNSRQTTLPSEKLLENIVFAVHREHPFPRPGCGSETLRGRRHATIGPGGCLCFAGSRMSGMPRPRNGRRPPSPCCSSPPASWPPGSSPRFRRDVPWATNISQSAYSERCRHYLPVFRKI